MLSVDKLLGLAGVGSTIANIALLKRFLSGLVVVIALTALCGTITGMFLVAGLYILYLALIHHGLDPYSAALTISGMALFLVVVLGALATWRWQGLKEMNGLLFIEPPIVNRISKMADSFIAGLLTERSGRRSREE